MPTKMMTLVPTGAKRAREILGDEKYELDLAQRIQAVNRVLALNKVSETWVDGLYQSGGIGFKTSYFGTLYSPEGDLDEAIMLGEVEIMRAEGVQGELNMVKTYFWVKPGENLVDAFARCENRLKQALGVQKLPSRAYMELEARVAVMWLQLRGRFFWHGNFKDSSEALYYDYRHNIDGGKDRGGYLMKIDSDDFRTWLASHTASKAATLKKESQLFNLATMAALNPEVSSPVVPAHLWDRRGDVIYISNGDSMVVRISAGKVEMVPNGTDDVVFTPGKTLEKWKLLDGDGEDPFETTDLFTGASYSSPHGRMIVRLWFLGMFACLKAKPALVFTGRARSGKTRAAEGISELVGVKHRCASIAEKGEDDFWVSVDAGGVLCFDNVDTKSSWFSDAMQLACTKGMKEKRRLYHEDIRTYEAKASIMLTSNNPTFANESGLVDRLQICRLESRTVAAGSKTDDSKLSRDIMKRRDRSLTWVARTIAKALSDTGEVEQNVNMRHPDYADFVLRCSRALGCYTEAVAALKSAEFDKALWTIENDRVAKYILDYLKQAGGVWSGPASEMTGAIRKAFGVDENDRAVSDRSVGKVLNKFLDQFLVCFDGDRPRMKRGMSFYCYRGFSTAWAMNVGDGGEDLKDYDSKNQSVENSGAGVDFYDYDLDVVD